MEAVLELEINEADQNTFGPCHKDNGAFVDLILGEWGDHTIAADRVAVALDYRCLDSGPALMIIDATLRPIAKNGIVGKALSREEVIGTDIAQKAFAIGDEVLIKDPRTVTLGCGDELRH